MGGLCSKHATPKPNPYSKGRYDVSYFSAKGDDTRANDSTFSTTPDIAITGARKSVDRQLPEEPRRSMEAPFSSSYTNSNDYFYDGIPRYTSSMARSSRSAAVAKVSEVSTRLGKAGTVGLVKAVEVLDTLGSSMTSLNPNNVFSAAVATKGNELGILSFEVANTIVKGGSLMEFLSRTSMRHLEETVLPSDGVLNLISNDMNELLRIVASDKREEFKVFSSEVVRFGNRSKDPQWHNLDRYFEKISRGPFPNRPLKEEAESVIDILMTLVQCTAELYHELQLLDRIEQECERKRRMTGNSPAILKAELKNQKKLIRNLKKKSLWSRSLEGVMEKLVDVAHFLLLEIRATFPSVDDVQLQESTIIHHKLGPAGLSLHYANVIMQIDAIVARSSSMPSNARDTLYQNLPPSVKSALRVRLQSFHVKEEFTITEIKEEMEKTLQWLVPISVNTAKAHHGFGWVGEWANGRPEVNPKPNSGSADIIRIETLHHADKERTEAYILELVLWLHHLIHKCKTGTGIGRVKTLNGVEKLKEQPKHERTKAALLTVEEQQLVQESSKMKGVLNVSRSLNLESQSQTVTLRKHDRLSKSYGHGISKESKGLGSVKRMPSSVLKRREHWMLSTGWMLSDNP